MSGESWRFFALQLFQCRDEPHKIGGIQLDGYLKGGSVLVFNHQKQPGVRIDDETIRSLHEALGSKVGRRMYIVAPALVFDFQQDYIDVGNVRYYALRIASHWSASNTTTRSLHENLLLSASICTILSRTLACGSSLDEHRVSGL